MAGGPTGGSVAVGSATITTPNANQTVVNQSSKKALINWTDFSVSNGSSVIFNQPNSKSLTVNRVTGPNASAIYGELLANGSIWLINANGILFGHGSQINVGALLATTSDITDDDFKKGHNNFAKASSNPDASVVNQGTITAKRGGSVVLSAAHVSNEGMIQADLGTVVLGGASAFTVDMKGDNLLRYQIAAPVTQAPKDAQGNPQSALVSNSGTISANGGTVLMTASAAKSVEDNVINNTGMVEATSVSSHNGEIDLDAGPDGTVNVGGTLDASGTAKGQAGGAINITGGTVNVADGTKINASGDAGGGTIQIGGGLHGKGTLANAQTTNVGNATITADAISKGNGGTVTVWADGSSSFSGSISAKGGAKGGNGGSVETSGGHLNVGNSATVNTSSALGLTGDWLLDPTDINIETGGGDGIGGSNIDPNTISSALGSTNVTLEASDDIFVRNIVIYSSSNTLSLLARQDIIANASVQNAGNGALNLIAGWDGTTTDLSSLTNPGVSGNNNGSVTINSNSAVGSTGGMTTVAGYDITLNTFFGFAQIGYRGSGGGGINVLATNNLSLFGGASAAEYAQIGNGDVAGGISGNVTGNIGINVGGATILENGRGGLAWLGNASELGAIESGDVTLITGTAHNSDIVGSVDVLVAMMRADLGTTASPGSGGDFTVGFTKSDVEFSPGTDFVIDSPHNLTLLTASGIEIENSLINVGSGNITLVAGWDPTVAPANVLTVPGAYGLNNSTILIGGAHAPGNVSIGTANGLTSVSADNVWLDAANGYAQLGLHGASGGDITVVALNNLTLTGGADVAHEAQIGNGLAFARSPEGNVSLTVRLISTLGSADLTGNSANIVLSGSGDSVGSDKNPLEVALNELSVLANNGSAYISSPTQGLSIGLGANGIDLGDGELVLAADGPLTQSGAIVASGLDVTTTNGAITLTNSGNAFGTATLGTSGTDNASLYDASNLTIGGASVGGTLTLTDGGSIGQSGAIVASGLDVTTTNGAITLTNSGNAFGTATLGTSGTDNASLYDASNLTIGGASVGGTLTLTDGGSIGQSGAIVASGLDVTTTNGAITLTNSGNAFGTATLGTSGTDNASLYDASNLTIGGASVGGTLTLLTRGNIGQSSAIVARGLDVTTTNGAITLTNSGNAFGTATLGTSGTDNASLYDASNLTIGGASVGGTLTLTDGGSIGQSGAIVASGLDVASSTQATPPTNSGKDFST